MAARKTRSSGRALAPAGFEQSAEVLARVTRIAETLFHPASSQITLLIDGAPWRSSDPDGRLKERAAVAEIVIATGQSLWVADARADARFKDHPFVTGEMGLRLIVAAPIRLPDGSIPGALVVGGREPLKPDPELAARLDDLAELVGDEWRRIEIKRAQEASAQESEAVRRILGSIIDSAPLSLIMLNKDLRILAASRRWLDGLKLRRRDAVGRTLAELIPQGAAWTPNFERCLAGETMTFDRSAVEMPDGTVQWVRSELTPWLTGSGEVGGVLVAAHDITDVVEALERAERSEERLKLALEIADIHVWEMDYIRQELIKEGAEETFFDRPKTYSELYRDIWAPIDPRDREAVQRAWNAQKGGAATDRPVFRVVRSDGKEIWAAGAVHMLHDEQGQPLRMVGALQNVTHHKRTELALVRAKEDAEAATRAKSAFLATMSHEIRTPLNGVLGMAQAMARDELSPVQRERLDVVRQSGEALLAILNDVLDLSKIEAGKLELEAADFDMGELARAAHATFAATAQNKGLEFHLHVTRAAQGPFVGDSVRVRQILYNLVSNALKFTEKGAVRIDVGRRGGALVMKVIDTGIGIAPEKLASLFQKFEQADASTTRRYGGTGLGLAICRDLTEMMGGQIEAASVPGEGTVFTVRLPLAKAAQTSSAAPVRRKRAEPRVVLEDRPLRVLAAEDNGMNQLVLKTLLGQIGVEPVIVGDGRAAVAAWEAEPWDLILMDVQMPEMDGPTATAIIRARETTEGRPRTPIVALTANAMDHQVAEYRAAGMDGFVAKPIEAGRLFEAVLAAAEQSSPTAGDAAAA